MRETVTQKTVPPAMPDREPMTEAASTPPKPPSLRELLLSNLKILAGSLLLAILAYGMWRLLTLLFPDVAWLHTTG